MIFLSSKNINDNVKHKLLSFEQDCIEDSYHLTIFSLKEENFVLCTPKKNDE